MITLEICTGDPSGVDAAIAGGADRVELCSALEVGGLTPSVAMIRYASSRIKTNVLIRVRPGDFVYTDEETEVMGADAEEAVRAGAAGIVIGALTTEGKIDVAACEKIINGARHLSNTFHRAFDLVPDPEEALEQIISLGFSRVLTSGQAPTALEGADLIRKLRELADGRIEILAGAGVSPGNISDLIERTGVKEVHSSAKRKIGSSMRSTNNLSMGAADSVDGSRTGTDLETVKDLRRAIGNLV